MTVASFARTAEDGSAVEGREARTVAAPRPADVVATFDEAPGAPGFEPRTADVTVGADSELDFRTRRVD